MRLKNVDVDVRKRIRIKIINRIADLADHDTYGWSFFYHNLSTMDPFSLYACGNSIG